MTSSKEKSMRFATPDVSYDLDPQAVAEYILMLDSRREDPDVTQLKLHKLLYLAQANYLASTGRRLMDSDVEAFRHGPVIDAIRSTYKPYDRDIIVNRHKPSKKTTLPPDAADFLNRIWEMYQDNSASYLRNLTHRQDPWRDNYVEGESHTLIPDADMADYFSQKVPVTQRVFHPNVIVVYQDFLDSLDDGLVVDQTLEALA